MSVALTLPSSWIVEILRIPTGGHCVAWAILEDITKLYAFCLLIHFFRVWLQHAKRQFHYKLSVTGLEQITLAIYCRHGKHRSVAAALILGHILQAEGFDCCTEHLASQHWPCTIGCRVCANPPAALYRSVEQALEIWRQL